MWLAVDQEHFAHHQFVRCPPQRVVAHEDRLEHTIGPIAGRLLGAGTVEAPDRRLLTERHYLALGPQLVHGSGAVHPDVLSLVVVVLLWQRLSPFVDCVADYRVRPPRRSMVWVTQGP